MDKVTYVFNWLAEWFHNSCHCHVNDLFPKISLKLTANSYDFLLYMCDNFDDPTKCEVHGVIDFLIRKNVCPIEIYGQTIGLCQHILYLFL